MKSGASHAGVSYLLSYDHWCLCDVGASYVRQAPYVGVSYVPVGASNDLARMTVMLAIRSV